MREQTRRRPVFSHGAKRGQSYFDYLITRTLLWLCHAEFRQSLPFRIAPYGSNVLCTIVRSLDCISDADILGGANDERQVQFLDALQGIAVLLVVLDHFVGHSPALRFVSGSFLEVGQAGVSLFFLISGYIIPRSISSAPNLRVFWAHRVMRLYPIYWASIAVAPMLTAFGLYRPSSAPAQLT